MLQYRILSALIMIPLAIAGLFLLPTYGFAAVLLIICALGAWEWGQFSLLKVSSHRILFAIVVAVLLWLSFETVYLQGTPMIKTDIVKISLLLALGWWPVSIGLVLFYPNSEAVWKRSMLTRILFGLLILVPFFFSIVTLREYGTLVNGNSQGAWWVLYVMLLVWGADTGAYVFGRLFGKNKLAPKVSPGKTWEGVVGGLVIAALVAWIASHFVQFPISTPQLLFCSLITVIASIFGDLVESMFKREAGIKDSSHLIPGHGGVLDRLDSLTAALPIFTVLLFFILGVFK